MIPYSVSDDIPKHDFVSDGGMVTVFKTPENFSVFGQFSLLLMKKLPLEIEYSFVKGEFPSFLDLNKRGLTVCPCFHSCKLQNTLNLPGAHSKLS